ncbi:NlpC/P60 family protein [Candidatus Dependentiae bacterium]|nr:NlpC/P60 family protein [Candidatus Dependentiae bacterium]
MFFIGLVVSMLFSSVSAQGEWHQVNVPITSIWTVPWETFGPFTYPAWGWPTEPGVVALKEHDSQLVLHERVIDLGDSRNAGMLHVAIPSQPDAEGKPGEGYINKEHVVPCGKQTFNTIMVVQALATKIYAGRRSNGTQAVFGSVLQHNELYTVGGQVVFTQSNSTVAMVDKCDVRVITAELESLDELRAVVCANALKFVGMPYCWGGRSPFVGDFTPVPAIELEIPTSVDCSGLIHLVMHSVGLTIPRNAGPQAACMQPVEPIAMQPGDIFYFKPLVAGGTRHVLMYLGNNQAIEAFGGLGAQSSVCISNVVDRFGVALSAMKNGMVLFADHPTRKCEVTCGSFLNNPEKLQAMRDAFLANVGYQA